MALLQELSWQEALAQVAAESVGGEEALSGTAPADLLPEAVLQQVGLAAVRLCIWAAALF